jgi:uncharacterized protein
VKCTCDFQVQFRDLVIYSCFRYIPDMSEIEKKLTEYLSDQAEILVAFLFGSEAAGRPRGDSDLDIGLLFHSERIPSNEKLLDLEDALTRLLKREVDLVVLNLASPIIRMQVLQKGRKLVERQRNPDPSGLSGTGGRITIFSCER